MPHLSKLLTDLKGKGFDIVSINLNGKDETPLIAKLWREQGYGMRCALGGVPVAEKYRVPGPPVNYLVAANGKILGVLQGFDEAALRKTLALAGVE